MALIKGNNKATSGMAKEIYDKIDQEILKPQEADLKKQVDNKKEVQEAIDKAREHMKKLAYSIAEGVITHLLSNLEIRGIKTELDKDVVSTSVNTVVTTPNGINGSGVGSGNGRVTKKSASQIKEGTGYIK